jgi:hypothetical protein
MPLQNLIARQAGVITRGQAIGAGLSAAAVDRRLRLRRWQPVHPGVYLAAGHHLDDEARARAAVLWAGPGAALSGLAAAWWHGWVDEAPARIAVSLPEPARRRAGVVTRHRRLGAVDLDERRGLRVTAPGLTALEAAVELGAAGEAFLDRVLQHRVGFPEVRAAHVRALAAPGAAAAARMLAASTERSAVAAGDRLAGMLREAGTRGWRRGFPVPGRHAPVVFPAARLAVEATGWAWRTDGPEVPAPPGWRVVRFSWAELTGRPRAVLAEIRAAIGP